MIEIHPKQRGIIESLEARIAPASVFVYTDVDGDHVTIHSSKGNLAGHVTLSAGASGYLTNLDLTDFSFQGANITFQVKKGPGGDGFANVGTIDAQGVDLGKVVVKGDLGSIIAGDGNAAKPAIKSLVVHSMGIYGQNTPGGAGGSGPGTGGGSGPDDNAVLSVLVDLVGSVGSSGGTLATVSTEIQALLGSGDLQDAGLVRLLNTLEANITTLGNLGGNEIQNLSPAVNALLANIGSDVGTLLTQFGTELGNANATLKTLLGTVQSDVNTVVHGLISPLGLDGTVTDALSAVSDAQSELVSLLSNPISPTIPHGLLSNLSAAIANVASSGSGQGGLGNLLGSVLGGVGNVLQNLVSGVSGDLNSLLNVSASVSLTTFLPELASLDANITAALSGGGSLSQTAQGLLSSVQSAVDAITALPQCTLTQVNADLHTALDALTNATLPAGLPQTIHGLVGNVEQALTNITSSLGTVLSSGGTIPGATLHDLSQLETSVFGLLGNAGTQLGSTVSNALNTILTDTLGLTGTKATPAQGTGAASESLAIASNINGSIGSLFVKTDFSNVFFNVAGNVKSLRVGGSIIGGSTENSGEIFCTGNVAFVVIGKNLIGGLNDNAGSIEVGGLIGSLRGGGSVLGGAGNETGEIEMHGNCKSVSIGGDLAGNSGLYSASIDDFDGNIGTVKIAGSMMAGTNPDSGAIRSDGDIGSLLIHGNVIGDASNAAEITAAAMKSPSNKADMAFGKIRIGGGVDYADLLAGYDPDTDAVSGHAQIGTVSVHGDWAASNLVAGAQTSSGAPDDFGTNSDQVISGQGPAAVISKIASVTIKGSVLGTANDSQDNFGFVAEQIGAFHFSKTRLHLHRGSSNDADILSQQTGGDVALHEIGAVLP